MMKDQTLLTSAASAEAHRLLPELHNLLDRTDADSALLLKALSRVRRASLALANAVEELTQALQHSRADRETAPPAIKQAT